MSVTDSLRRTIVQSGETHYRIAKMSGVDTRIIDRFVSGEAPNVRASTIDRLCVYLDLELRPKKQAAKKGQTARKQPSKNP